MRILDRRLGAMRWPAVVVFALLVSACGSTPTGPMPSDAYVAAMQEIEDEFREVADEVAAGEHAGYPLETQLIYANDLFVAFQDRLEGWQALTPPSEFADTHAALVAALDEVQHYVGDYLQEAALEGGFEFEDIVAQEHIVDSLDDARRACVDLRTAVREATGTQLLFADNCNF